MSSPMEGYYAPTNLQLFSMCMNVSLLSHGSRKTRKSDGVRKVCTPNVRARNVASEKPYLLCLTAARHRF